MRTPRAQAHGAEPGQSPARSRLPARAVRRSGTFGWWGTYELRPTATSGLWLAPSVRIPPSTRQIGPVAGTGGQLASSDATLRVRLGSTGIPGPMVVLSAIFLM